ncbi:hypothetical protein B0E53_01273 [Micromonospora sp. MH33]|nr:hypothetical protein B0E53_01273 [Micromonospora sp. MH33]
MASGYASSSGHQRFRVPRRKNRTTNRANAVCSDGMAATGLEAICPALSRLPAPCMPISFHPRVEIRATSVSSPFWAAHHGGAAG